NPVREATNDTPRGLREVTTEPDRVTVADTLTHERRATQETAPTGNRLGNIVRGQVDVQRVAVAVDRTPAVRLSGFVEGDAPEALAGRDGGTHTLDEVGLDAARHGGSGAQRDGLGRLGQVVIDRAGARPVTAEVVGDSEVERHSDRTGEVSTDLVRDVARVRADNLSRHHNDRGELLRLDRQKVQPEVGLRLPLTLTDPVRGRLTRADRDLLPVDAERHLRDELLEHGPASGLVEDGGGLLGGEEVLEICSSERSHGGSFTGESGWSRSPRLPSSATPRAGMS